MAFVTFVIAMAAIAAFYLYSTKPECRKAVNNWSTSACDILKEKIISSQDIIKQKEKRGTEAQQSGSPKGRLLSRTSDTDDKTAIVAEGETQAGIARRLSKTIQSQEEGQTSLSIRASTIGGMPEREVTKYVIVNISILLF
ncbi:hypothetical protein DINM_003063 [Dirofilaria immitis]|nr:hypothetical protein [Dirofilaria immitis]